MRYAKTAGFVLRKYVLSKSITNCHLEVQNVLETCWRGRSGVLEFWRKTENRQGMPNLPFLSAPATYTSRGSLPSANEVLCCCGVVENGSPCTFFIKSKWMVVFWVFIARSSAEANWRTLPPRGHSTVGVPKRCEGFVAIWLRVREESADNRFQLLLIYRYTSPYMTFLYTQLVSHLNLIFCMGSARDTFR